MIDPATREMLRAIQERALRDGVNLFEAMDRAGFLVTETERRKIWVQCLTTLLQQINEQQVTTFVVLGGGQNTPLDTTRGLCEFIDFFMKRYTD